MEGPNFKPQYHQNQPTKQNKAKVNDVQVTSSERRMWSLLTI
jgi:hypothetical protein